MKINILGNEVSRHEPVVDMVGSEKFPLTPILKYRTWMGSPYCITVCLQYRIF